ncbi:MAG: 4-hydroxythreonine-4-phosphate dehydrogenase, partial [Rhodobiaceae bacterium]|nr:4-hydroxythreonine-4-phosphate dehydrogenase [Rhodobiaceae bacterium]
MRPRRLAVSLGDPAGIGPELTLRAFLDRDRLGLPSFFAVGPVGALEAHAEALGLPCPVERCDAPEDI